MNIRGQDAFLGAGQDPGYATLGTYQRYSDDEETAFIIPEPFV